jgi:hypothetical protein
MYVYPLLGLFFAGVGILTCFKSSNPVSGAVFPFAASIFFFWYRFSSRKRWRKFYERQARDLSGRMTLTEEGISYETADKIALLARKWSGFDSWLERPTMFLLFTSSSLFFRIPKDKLSADEQDEVRGWIGFGSKRLR